MATTALPVDRSSQGDFRVALVGRRLVDNENLGLGYLAAALAEAGFASLQLHLNEAGDLARVGQRLLSGGFSLVGLSIPDGGSAYLPLALGEYLRQRGFDAPITCGGSFATLARDWLLARYPWLHSVVRFAGEVPLVALARALRDGSGVVSIPGLSTRAGDGPPAPVLDAKPLGLWPARGDLPRILGHRAAHLTATRGCAGRCGYCAPASLQVQEWREGTRAGASGESLRAAGVGRIRRREVLDLCDEMAWLWHERDVRYFYFVDEHVLPYQEAEALAFLGEMKAALRRRKVGRLGIGTMLRVDRLTKSIVRAFADVGLVRAFAGIEFATAEEGKAFARTCDPDHARAILAELDGLGVATVAHLMMVHPYSGEDTIAGAIRFMESAPAGLFELTQMRVYHGTWLWRRMGEEGRLSGNPMRYAYTMPDPSVARFNEIFMELRARSFWNHSIAYRTHDAFLALVLGQRLRPDVKVGTLPVQMRELREQLARLYSDSYRRALALAKANASSDEVTRLVEEACERSLRLQQRLDRLVADLACRLETSPSLFSPSRAAAAGALALSLLGPAVGCSNRPMATHADAGDAAGATFRDAVGSDARDAGPDASRDAAPAEPDSGCTQAMAGEQESAIEGAANAAAPCFSGVIHLDKPSGQPWAEPWYPQTFSARPCNPTVDGGIPTPAEDRWAAQVENAVAGLDHSCLCRSESWGLYCHDVHVSGTAGDEIGQVTLTVINCRDDPRNAGPFSVTIDDDGHVTGATGVTPEVSDCIVSALKDVVFPCLAGAGVCGTDQILVE